MILAMRIHGIVVVDSCIPGDNHRLIDPAVPFHIPLKGQNKTSCGPTASVKWSSPELTTPSTPTAANQPDLALTLNTANTFQKENKGKHRKPQAKLTMAELVDPGS